jgi:hypothetical protein
MIRAVGACVLAVATAWAPPVVAQSRASSPAPVWPWCAEYDMEGAVVNCGFATREQCLATTSGIGGGCRPNWAAAPAAAPKPTAAPKRAKPQRVRSSVR